MSYKIASIEGIGETYAEKLSKVGISTTSDLLQRCGDRAGRTKVEWETGISGSILLKWANMADLMRVSGVGPQFAELLVATGVDTVKELRQRNGENLAEQLKDLNEQKRLSRTVPAMSIVEGWIDQAKSLDAMITY